MGDLLQRGSRRSDDTPLLRIVYPPQGAPSFAAIFVSPWLALFPLAIGALALAMFAFLAAVYLAYASEDSDLREDFRRRGLGAAVAMFVAAFGALAVSQVGAAHVVVRLTARSALAFQAATALAALSAFWALWARRWAVARLAAAAQVSLILWGWVIVQYQPPVRRFNPMA